MKTKVFLAAVAVAFSFAVISCTGNKTANSGTDADSTAVETLEVVAVAEADSCCHGDSATCKKECDKKEGCNKAGCDKKEGCEKKKECCEKK